MPNSTEDRGKHRKESVSFAPGVYERAKRHAATLKPRVSTSAYISAVVESDLDKRDSQLERAKGRNQVGAEARTGKISQPVIDNLLSSKKTASMPQMKGKPAKID